ncbi:transcription termination/antitermination protein NusG [Williamsoniiplasma luminosum]|uniref:Transcription termination/antitermination protein NusG n=1 Tax=Williamsoniiplasma luminosum TaxID=214888 RepID=A0A2S0NKI8_9MOLU|nr:transcription termination/antitermination protein NusG [Williamsoniiplasma luminosum]AVP49526.1 MAG: transcription termination/antitermination protein NusG [Williamsoniiplasma luminosum]
MIDNNKLIDELLNMKGQWFVINSQTGHEDKVLSDLVQKIKTSNLQSDVFDVRISKGLTTTKAGKEVIKNRFPGYIFINMIMSEHAWFVVRNTPGVTGFIGSSGRGAKPFPLTDDEVIKMLTTPDKEMIEEQIAEPENVGFVVDQIVLINDGPYKGTEGKILELDPEGKTAIVSVEIFGRYTPAEVSIANIESLKEF